MSPWKFSLKNPIISSAFQHHCGKYDRCFPIGTGVIETLVDNGFVILLRVALDDQGASQLSEALKTLHSLVVNPNDEVSFRVSN